MKSVLLVLCRHCETDDNAAKRYTGQNDVPLNDIGKVQAAALAESLRAVPIMAVVSSDLLRARQTAAPIAAVWGSLVHSDPRLREVHIGAMAGLSKEVARVKYQSPSFDLARRDYDFGAIGGESRRQVVGRYMAAMRDITERFGTEDFTHRHVAVVGHGSALRSCLEDLGFAYDLKQGAYRIIPFSI